MTQVSNLSGPALDWAVAKCEGMPIDMLECFDEGEWLYEGGRAYSTNWSQGGPIIEREKIDLGPYLVGEDAWSARKGESYKRGPTPLIAAMRCYCCAKLGDEIDIPEELQPCQQPNL